MIRSHAAPRCFLRRGARQRTPSATMRRSNKNENLEDAIVINLALQERA